MTASSKLVTLVQELVPEGSQVRQAFMCQAAPHVWFFVINYLTYLTIFWIEYRVVGVTDDAVYVFRGTKFAVRPRELLATLPRSTRLGPVSGRWATIELLGEPYWVHHRFHPEITAADLEAA